jgi:hypothetical protein
MTLFWHPSGPKLTYRDGCYLHVSDLNPQIEHGWMMSRLEMLALGWRCIRAALRTAT